MNSDIASVTPETALWNRWRNGDESAFYLLFQHFHPLLVRYGDKFTHHRDIVEDAVQELFIELWKRNQFPEVKAPAVYIFRAFRYKLMRSLEKESVIKKTMAVDFDWELGEASFQDNRQFQELQQEKGNALFNAIGNLSPRQQEIVYLRFFAGLDYDAVADVMELNYQTSRNLLSQALKSLRKQLSFSSLGLLITLYQQ